MNFSQEHSTDVSIAFWLGISIKLEETIKDISKIQIAQ